MCLYRVLKHCTYKEVFARHPHCMQIGANQWICARPKVINKKEYHFSQKIGSNYAILVAVFIVGTVYV